MNIVARFFLSTAFATLSTSAIANPLVPSEVQLYTEHLVFKVNPEVRLAGEDMNYIPPVFFLAAADVTCKEVSGANRPLLQLSLQGMPLIFTGRPFVFTSGSNALVTTITNQNLGTDVCRSFPKTGAIRFNHTCQKNVLCGFDTLDKPWTESFELTFWDVSPWAVQPNGRF